MDLAGQGASASSRPGRSNLDDGGYILAVLLIGMAIAAVWMSAAIPAWRQQATRQRELELIFRGEQYARSVALYYVKNNCTLPTNVDDLVAKKYLRKKWNDPITNDDFIIIPGNPQGGGAPVGGAPGRAGTPGGTGAPVANRPAGGAPIGGGAPISIGGGAQPGGAQAPRPGTTGGTPAGGVPGTTGQAPAGSGIAGVMSKSTAASIIVYNGQQTYQGWQFLYQSQLQKMGQQPQCGGNQPGAAGRGNQPGQPGRGDGRGGPGVGAAPGRPGGPGRGGPGGDGRGPAPAGAPTIGRGRGGN